MDCRYLFNPLFSQIDICREGYEPVFVSSRKSFRWDESVQGIAFKMEVYSGHEATEVCPVRVKLVIIKDDDWSALQVSLRRFEEWKITKGEGSFSFAMDEASYQHILDLYRHEVQQTLDELSSKIVSERVMDYAMPVGKSKDCFIQVIPVEMHKMEVNTTYRICLFADNDIADIFQEWPMFTFSRLCLPVEEVFVPYAAYLKVREQKDGKLLFDQSIHYRHYKDFYADIHYDEVCAEVEVNPALVCVELEVNGYEDTLPFFHMFLNSGGQTLWHDDCYLLSLPGTRRVVAYCPLSTNSFPVASCREIEVELQVFDRKLTQFSFLTDRTEPGELRMRKL